LAALRFTPRVQTASVIPVREEIGTVVWVLRDGGLSPVSVVTGEDDGERVSIKAGDLGVGDLVAIGDRVVVGGKRASLSYGLR
jgi:multidrug efflux pump subunit AcrA (membrane-fusion protein)